MVIEPSPLPQLPVFGQAKAGVAYRRMTVEERVTVNDLSQAAFEVQAGLGLPITPRAQLALLYQGIFSGTTRFTVNSIAETGHISNIPAQNGVLLTLNYQL